jgi:hypothetical protein
VSSYFLDAVLELTVPFVEGAAAIVLGFSFLGFFASRLPRCSPLAIACLQCCYVPGKDGFSHGASC